MHAKDRKRLETIARANGHWHLIQPFANALARAEAQLAEAKKLLIHGQARTDGVEGYACACRFNLDPAAPDEPIGAMCDYHTEMQAQLADNQATLARLQQALTGPLHVMHPTQAEVDAASLIEARANGTAERAVDDLLSHLEGSQKKSPSLSKRMTEAGYPRRDTRLECEDCGKLFSAQFLPIHKCDKIEGT